MKGRERQGRKLETPLRQFLPTPAVWSYAIVRRFAAAKICGYTLVDSGDAAGRCLPKVTRLSLAR